MVRGQLLRFIAERQPQGEIVFRMLKQDQSQIWVSSKLSLILDEDGTVHVYAVHHDITKERLEQQRIRQQYNELILEHYRTPGENALVAGHCNITRGRILDINVRFTTSMGSTIRIPICWQASAMTARFSLRDCRR